MKKNVIEILYNFFFAPEPSPLSAPSSSREIYSSISTQSLKKIKNNRLNGNGMKQNKKKAIIFVIFGRVALQG